MRITTIPYKLQFKHPFKIAHGLRMHTDVVYVKLEEMGFTAWGEAALPPYLPETQQSVIDFINPFANSFCNASVEECFEALAQDTSSNLAAKAALDMALWDLRAQIAGKTVKELLDADGNNFPLGTYTIGVSAFDEMKAKVEEATALGFGLFKLKLTGEGDEEVVMGFKQLTEIPFAVDVNQGWKNVDEALIKIKILRKAGCLFVEQPLHKDDLIGMKELKRNKLLPIYADESCQRLIDIEKLKDCCDGINIKLMKCGGLTEARQMIADAKEYKLKVLIGCMSESSVGCTAAAQLAPLADYADLDGPYLNANDPFTGMKVENGRIALYPLEQTRDLK